MLNEILLKIQRIPSLLLGFIVIVGVIIALYYNDPPKTICDIQMQEVNQRLQNGFFSGNGRSAGYESGVLIAFNNCLKANSSGGCREMFERLKFLVGIVKTIPTECGSHSSTASIRKFTAKGLRLFALIAWGEEPPKNKYNKTSWLDTTDLGLFCRLKGQYIRLYGAPAWKAFAWGHLSRLPGALELQKQEIWDKGLYSYNCANLY